MTSYKRSSISKRRKHSRKNKHRKHSKKCSSVYLGGRKRKSSKRSSSHKKSSNKMDINPILLKMLSSVKN